MACECAVGWEVARSVFYAQKQKALRLISAQGFSGKAEIN